MRAFAAAVAVGRASGLGFVATAQFTVGLGSPTRISSTSAGVEALPATASRTLGAASDASSRRVDAAGVTSAAKAARSFVFATYAASRRKRPGTGAAPDGPPASEPPSGLNPVPSVRDASGTDGAFPRPWVDASRTDFPGAESAASPSYVDCPRPT
ncbi:MAG: hypothetical protein K0R99_4429 [Microbacterium sp.]|nr:hypothetical protein [Microbacterium sp.]